MMRLVATCLGISLVFAPLTVAGQQAQPTTSKTPEQRATTSHRGQSRKAAAAEKGALHCQPPEIPVDVINGARVLHTCFDPRLPAEETKSAPGQLAVEVINGSTENTQFFYGNGRDEQIEAMLNKPVVVGVQSGDTRTMGGNRQPLVTRVNSAGTGSYGQPVTNRISPRPKRPAYQPDVK
jgi:hypothetical protein